METYNKLNEKPMQEGPECSNSSDHEFNGEPVCELCGVSYAEIYCDAYNREER